MKGGMQINVDLLDANAKIVELNINTSKTKNMSIETESAMLNQNDKLIDRKDRSQWWLKTEGSTGNLLSPYVIYNSYKEEEGYLSFPCVLSYSKMVGGVLVGPLMLNS